MAIRKPDKVLLRNIPLAFVQRRVTGHANKSVNHEIPLIPFIDFLIVLVIFLLMSFSASGELVAQQPTIEMPDAINAEMLELAPVVAIDAKVVTLDGKRVADTQSLGQTVDAEPIDLLVSGLDSAREEYTKFHPGTPFPGVVIVQADKAIDFRVIKQVMFSAAAAGYGNVSFAVNPTATE